MLWFSEYSGSRSTNVLFTSLNAYQKCSVYSCVIRATCNVTTCICHLHADTSFHYFKIKIGPNPNHFVHIVTLKSNKRWGSSEVSHISAHCKFSLDQTGKLEPSFLFLLKFRKETGRVKDRHFLVLSGADLYKSRVIRKTWSIICFWLFLTKDVPAVCPDGQKAQQHLGLYQE